MNNRNASRRYERLYYVLSKRMERRALLLITALLVLLVIYQLLLLVPDMKKNMTSIDRLEGTPIQMQTVHEQSHH
ncbi:MULTISPECIES: hypothetical protein [unclassified Paenibacillus]|uniref:hypothetical protein n=1 Tax=unclassified Paenibacillus TaxID=185978 RepID=UPI0008BB7094|nr:MULTISPECIES: hypothetical protein [unclassified Paenibacillus]QLG39688.1 hypothetical protein HW560_17320 [Paenibacillus sp. E222]SEO00156.1 hypothetical protein SAMN05518670_3337 [Paenibacillus sp. OK076]